MSSCTNCDADNPVGSKFCKQCGTSLAALQSAAIPPGSQPLTTSDSCLSCGAALNPGAKFCKKCGISAVSVPVAEIAPVVAVETVAVVAPTAVAVAQLVTVVESPMNAPSPAIISEPKPDPEPLPVVAPPILAISETTSAPTPTDIPFAAVADTSHASGHDGADKLPPSLPVTDAGSDQKQLKMIVAGVVAIAVIAGGLFWWQSGKQPAEAAGTLPPPITDSVSATDTAAPSAPAPVPAEEVVPATAATTSQELVPAVTPPAPAAPVVPEKVTPAIVAKVAPPQEMQEKPAPAKKNNQAKPAETNDQVSAPVAGLLAKANTHLSSGQYDKAIATAESILAIDPANRAAKALIIKAKARQMDALKSNSSLE